MVAFGIVLLIGFVLVLICVPTYRALHKEEPLNLLDFDYMPADKDIRKRLWKAQETRDKDYFSKNPDELKNYVLTLQALDYTKSEVEKLEDKNRGAEYCVRAFTPILFVECYNELKTKDRDEIKNAIFKLIPYFLHDYFIYFALYIFENNKEKHALKFIIKNPEGDSRPEDIEKAKAIYRKEFPSAKTLSK